MAAKRKWLERLARLGYAARGVVSLMVGLLALLAAVGQGGAATGSKGALRNLLSQPLGTGLLGATALGLFGFALWRGMQSVFDADGLGRSWRAIATRAGQFISAAIYVGLGVVALSLIIGSNSGGEGEQSARDWTRWLMEQPFGRWLVGAVGLGVAVGGLGMAGKAWSASFKQHLDCGPEAASWVIPLGRAGFAARAVVFLLIGGFLVVAAYQSDPSEARGLGGALLTLQEQPFGWALFAIVALGFAAFGVFEFAMARYRRIVAPSGAEAAAEIGLRPS